MNNLLAKLIEIYLLVKCFLGSVFLCLGIPAGSLWEYFDELVNNFGLPINHRKLLNVVHFVVLMVIL